ncbi:MAG: hypothetical protein JNJ45_08395 [Chthonomonas sp.]|nr:hypothetical protein [Chthonomonas sp.]
MKVAIVALGLALSMPVVACVNDVDTRNLTLDERSPAAIAIEDFPRMPDSYYEARIKRLVQLSPRLDLAEYDDLSVAYDRIGDSAKALETALAREQAWSTGIKQDYSRLKDEIGGLQPETYLRYSGLANRGTFRIHLWFQRGKPKDISLLTTGLAELKQAVKINPNAHAGREWAQIGVVEAVIQMAKGQRPNFDFGRNAAETARGLLGLAELGNAWTNPDIFALANMYAWKADDKDLASLTYLRYRELTRYDNKATFGLTVKSAETIRPHRFTLARHTADRRHEQLVEFVEGRIKAGFDPDDEKFWDGYKRPEPIVVAFRDDSTWAQIRQFWSTWRLIIVPVSIPIFIYILVKLLRKRHQLA